MEINSFRINSFRINSLFYEDSKTGSSCIISIDRNTICLASFNSKTFRSKVELDSDGFLTTTLRLGLIDKTITTLVLAMDQRDGEDLLEVQTTLLTTIAIQIEGSLIIVATRRLPDYVCLDRSLRIDPISADIYKDQLISRMLMNLSVSSCGAPNSLFCSRFDVLSTTN